jgi:hypothetical protein
MTIFDRICSIALLAAALLPVGTGHAEDSAGGAWRFRLGPVVEFGCDAAGVRTAAVRPLFSRMTDPSTLHTETEVVWPLATASRRDERLHWRVVIALGSDADTHDPDSRYSFWLLPVYTQGRSLDGHDYAALFPLYGTIDRVLWMEDVNFVLFPLYLRYRSGHTENTYMPWPFYRRAEREDGDVRRSYFPFYGSSATSEQTGRYVFWPFWTEQVFHRAGQRGEAQMLFPVYARVETEREKGWMALPPFFGYSENLSNGFSRLRCPWPFVVREDGPIQRRSYWPAWGERRIDDQRDWYALWPLVGGERHETPTQLFTSTRVVPFYYSQTRMQRRGGEVVGRTHYERIWPLYSFRQEGVISRLRIAEFWPVQHGGAIERNWAPFWSWYVREARGPACDSDLLWGLVRWGADGDGGRYGQLAGAVSWQVDAGGTRTWRAGGCAPGVPPGGRRGKEEGK